MSVAMPESGGGGGEGDKKKAKGISCAPEIPAGFLELLRDFTREVLRTQPLNIYSFGAKYFRRKLSEASGPGYVSSQCSADEHLDDSVSSLWPEVHKACIDEDSEGAHLLKWPQMSKALKALEMGLSDVQVRRWQRERECMVFEVAFVVKSRGEKRKDSTIYTKVCVCVCVCVLSPMADCCGLIELWR